MPPERSPPDRKDFVFREGKHDGGPPQDGLGVGSLSSPSLSSKRWRDQYLSPSPRRAFSGQYSQIYPDDTGGRVFTPTGFEGQGFRSRYGGGSGRYSSGRDNRGNFRRSPWNSGNPTRQNHDIVENAAQRSVADPLTPTSSSSSQLASLKAHRDKNDGGTNDGPHTGLGDGKDRDHSLGPIAWIPLKWSRTGSFSSSTKHFKSDSDEGKAETSVPSGKEASTEPLSMSSNPTDEGNAKKKPRLGWGQGLMKYEKQKEGPEDSSGKNVIVQGSSSVKLTNTGVHASLTGPGGSSSPATPSSITSGLSHALEEKMQYSTANNDDRRVLVDSPVHEFQRSLEGFSPNLEHFNAVSLSYVNSLIAEVLLSEDVCSGDYSSTRQLASEKLLLLKDDALKVLEKTVVDIDFLESELKNLDAELNGTNICPASQSEEDLISKKECNTCSSLSSISVSDNIPVSQPDPRAISFDEFQAVVKEHRFNGAVITKPELNDSNMGKHISTNVTSWRSDGDSCMQTTGSMDSNTQVSLADSGKAVEGVGVSIIDAYHRDNSYSSCAESPNEELGCNLVAQIMAHNKEAARKASEVLGRQLSSTASLFNGEKPNISIEIKEKLRTRKKILKFKEQALALKYRAFYLLWKEDQRLLSIMKKSPKLQKRCEISCLSLQNTSPRHNFSSGFQFCLPGNLTLMPTKEIVNFTSKLPSDSKIKIHRNHLKMPALILDEMERRHSIFITKNGLVEDPVLFEKEKALINPWSVEEKKIFLEMLGTFGKDFKKIASFLDHKTTADCIEFYYKNRKSRSFETVKKRLKARKQLESLASNSCLVPSGDKLKCESDSTSLDLLGEVAIAAHSNDVRIQQKSAGRSSLGSPHDSKVSFGNYTKVSSDEFHAETTAADVLLGIGNTISSEGMGSCITTSVDFGEKLEHLQVDHPFLHEDDQTIDEEDACSDEDSGERESNDWTDEERSIFIRALHSYGRDFTRISHCLGTRSQEQCKIFFSKARKCLALDLVCQGASGNDGEMPSSNEGRSETDDACVAEMDSAICSNQSCSKDDFTESGKQASGEPSPEVAQAKMVKPSSDFLNDREKQSTRNGASQSEMPTSHSISDKFEKPYGAVDNGIKKHVNALISPVTSATTEQLVKAEPDSVEDLPHVGASSHVDDCSKVKLESCFPDCGVKCKLELPRHLPVIGCGSSQKSTYCNAGVLEPNFDTKESACSQENLSYFHSDFSIPSPLTQVQSSVHSDFHKTQVFSWSPENFASISAKTALPETAYTRLDIGAVKQSSAVLEDHTKKHQRAHYPLGIGYSAQASDSPQIFRGYPVQILNENKMVGNKLDGKKNGNLDHGPPLVPSSHDDQIGDHRHDDIDLSVPFVPKSNESSDAQLRPCSQGPVLETQEQSLRTGDFKLFGKILSHPPAIVKSLADEKSHSPKPGSLSLESLKEKTDKAFPPLQTETRPTTGIEELPLITYGFWDGRRIQMGLPSMPDASILLSKYAGASNMTYHTDKEITGASGNGTPINRHSFSVNGNQDIFCEKRNGFEALANLQRQDRVAISSRVRNGSTLGGVSCTGNVSDPVAAIRLSYASQMGLLCQEEETWRGDRGAR